MHLRELIAVVNTLQAFRQYLLDRPFDLHTDNASLQWFMTQRSLSSHQARWLNLIAEYRFRVVHIPGTSNPADALSRQRFPDGQGPAAPPRAADAPDFEAYALAGTPALHVRGWWHGRRSPFPPPLHPPPSPPPSPPRPATGAWAAGL